MDQNPIPIHVNFNYLMDQESNTNPCRFQLADRSRIPYLSYTCLELKFGYILNWKWFGKCGMSYYDASAV